MTPVFIGLYNIKKKDTGSSKRTADKKMTSALRNTVKGVL